MISNTNHQKLVSVIIVSLFVLNAVFAQDPLTKAKSLIVEKKYDLAIEQYKRAVILQPNNILLIADSCYAESSKLLKNGNRPEAKKLFDYACKTLQSRSQSFTENFYTYLELINDNDSIFNIILKLYPNYSDWNLKTQLMKTNLSCLGTRTGMIYKNKDGYCDDLWLFPSGGAELNEKLFGMSSFNPIVSDAITKIELSTINSLTPTAIIRSVKEDQLYIKENWAVGLRISAIPELNELFAPLKDMSDFQIAAEKDRIVNGIKSFREKYLLANLKYIFTKFQIKGCCYIYKKNYDFNSKQIDLHLSISNQSSEGLYIATVRVPLSLEDAQIIFENGEGYKADVFYMVSPGTEIKGLGISGGGVSRWGMPNLYMIDEPIISINFPKKSFKFRTNGLKGELWTGVDTHRWDLNKEDQPFRGRDYGQLTRIINGFNLLEIQEAENFLTANKKREGVITLASGLQYEIIKNGTGLKPKLEDLVKCHYHGTTIDGIVFDSSVDRGEPATFPVNRVISGWTEALQLMPVGSKWKLFIPASLAYGEQGAGQYIKPNSTLIFEFELLEILKQTPQSTTTNSSQSILKYQGTYLIKGDNTFDEGKLVFKVSNSKLIGLCEQGVNPMGGLAKRKYEVTAIGSNGAGEYIYSYAIYDRKGELLQDNKAAAKGYIKFGDDRVRIGNEVYFKIK